MLLRLMLSGHPGLFAASELQLLGFETLPERRAALSGRYRPWLEGTIRSVGEIKRCGTDRAEQVMKEFEKKSNSTLEVLSPLPAARKKQFFRSDYLPKQ